MEVIRGDVSYNLLQCTVQGGSMYYLQFVLGQVGEICFMNFWISDEADNILCNVALSVPLDYLSHCSADLEYDAEVVAVEKELRRDCDGGLTIMALPHSDDDDRY